jgi:hypothetical protein
VRDQAGGAKLRFFGPKWATTWQCSKMVGIWEVCGTNFGVLRVPDHRGTQKCDLEQKSFEKNVFLTPNWPKMPQNGPKWGSLGGGGSTGSILGF